ncbi:tetratricopeptide repeat protein [Pseudodesulfovibrio sp. F-1]|uniref:Tetratricopeptide repeat protein n=1 Tax=Pseudodesulfovibrio alkaliphilus TaxID=2661613 RepID=A0A7K1KJM1_9BACT|nr:tetratricopeptide repeat protein [Pseudodesulfovibrio alkaliphilus]MUM76283.1 tetratricopeptide repeat protein [Pseudodesulfovibrio alkaliphilus]
MVESKTAGQATLDEIEARVPSSLHPVLEAAFKYRKQIVAGVAAIILAAAAYAAYSGYAARTLAEAQSQLGVIVIEASGQDRLDRLETLLGTAPSSAKAAVLSELAQSAMKLEDWDKAANAWSRLAGVADKEMKIVARLGEAKCLLLAGRADEALTNLKSLAGMVPTGFAAPVYRQLALAAEKAGDTAQALQAYRRLAGEQVSDKPFIDHKIAQLEAN